MIQDDAPVSSLPAAQSLTAAWRFWLMLGGGVVLLCAFGLWFAQRNQESTDDAFIEADIVEISPHISGYINRVEVTDNQRVKAGQLLALIDPRDYVLRVQQAEAVLAAAKARHGATSQDLSVVTTTTTAAVREARSALASALAAEQQAVAESSGSEAEAQLTHSDVQRYQALYEKQEISRQRLDQALTADRAAQARKESAQRAVEIALARVGEARARLDEAGSGPRQVALKRDQEAGGQASVAEAEAALAQARLDLSYTRLEAPSSGKVTHKTLLLGQLVQPGTVVLSLVTGAPWVVANFKETQLHRMRRGQKVKIRVDAFPGREWHGHIDSFQDGTGSRFSLLPPENATGNYVKVVQRVPVKIVFDEPLDQLQRLSPGLSATPTVELDSGGLPF